MKELSLNILDIVQNSITASANRITIRIMESVKSDLLTLTISDNGIGIPEELIPDVTDPFVTGRTTRKVGMGLAFLKHHSELTGGKLLIESVPSSGTRVKASFCLTHYDRQPIGDTAGIIKILVFANPGIHFILDYRTDLGKYYFDTEEIKLFLGLKNLTDHVLLESICELIRTNIESIGGSGFNWFHESTEPLTDGKNQ